MSTYAAAAYNSGFYGGFPNASHGAGYSYGLYGSSPSYWPGYPATFGAYGIGGTAPYNAALSGLYGAGLYGQTYAGVGLLGATDTVLRRRSL
eukprot:TRINITY_DN3670_c0_g1_i1.p1 TRINITY_DN3670_c0_g1~~TRINITY_DN3670_c0_g1_i1.p1  ORF type:complete len:102 (-),score=0.04 TRINITY_DN3670_c0_g1_i1:60-335(-)